MSELEESEEEASFSDSDVSEAPKPKKRAGKGKKEKTESEEESEAEDTPSEVDSDVSDAPKPKKVAKPKPKAAAPKRASTASRKSSEKVVSDDEEEKEEEAASPAKPKPIAVAKSEPVPTVEKSDAEDDAKPDQAAEDSDSDLSVLIDEPPKRAKSSSKSAKPSTSKTPKAAPSLSPADAEIKTLQSQLVKCGIRKIWQFELKDYGDDSKAKIKHLKSMLRDVGMEGRFSEARAREIKEIRELAQDVEAVTEGAKLWGKRGRRSEGKEKVVLDEDGSGSEESEEEVQPRRAKRKDDLAFLGDESESD